MLNQIKSVLVKVLQEAKPIGCVVYVCACRNTCIYMHKTIHSFIHLKKWAHAVMEDGKSEG